MKQNYMDVFIDLAKRILQQITQAPWLGARYPLFTLKSSSAAPRYAKRHSGLWACCDAEVQLCLLRFVPRWVSLTGGRLRSLDAKYGGISTAIFHAPWKNVLLVEKGTAFRLMSRGIPHTFFYIMYLVDSKIIPKYSKKDFNVVFAVVPSSACGGFVCNASFQILVPIGTCVSQLHGGNIAAKPLAGKGCRGLVPRKRTKEVFFWFSSLPTTRHAS